MSHRILASAAPLVLLVALLGAPPLAQPLDAQILRVPERDRSAHPISVALSLGFMQTQDRFDGQSGVNWQLGEAVSYRASLEYGFRSGALGVAASTAAVPMRRDIIGSGEGEIQLRQYLATFRTPETEGFFQVVELGLGLGQWTSYSGPDVLTEEEREPRNALAMAIGYGFGFKLGDRFSVVLVQDAGTLIGSKSGVPSGRSRAVGQYTTRIGGRIRLTR